MNALPGRPIFGYSTREHLLLDLDHTTATQATRLLRLVQHEYPQLGACLLVESTAPVPHYVRPRRRPRLPAGTPWLRGSYHAIFANRRPWHELMTIIETLAGLGVLERDFAYIRTWRGDLTLRVTERRTRKGVAPVPRPLRVLCYARTHRDDLAWVDYLRVLSAFRPECAWPTPPPPVAPRPAPA